MAAQAQGPGMTPFLAHTSEMYVTVPYVKCKTKKCGETIIIDKPFASGEVRPLRCRRGHTNQYDASNIDTRTAKATKGSGLKPWR
jgi:hypothetical protein